MQTVMYNRKTLKIFGYKKESATLCGVQILGFESCSRLYRNKIFVKNEIL